MADDASARITAGTEGRETIPLMDLAAAARHRGLPG